MRLTDRTPRRLASDLLTIVRKLDNLESSWRVIQSNGRSSKSENVRLELEEFAENPTKNLRSIQSKLGHNTFRFAPAKGVPIPKSDARGRKTEKFRPIVLAPVENRIVQRAILNVLLDLPALQPYIKTPYSFGGIRSKRGEGEEKLERKESISAVPAAIQAVLDGIAAGGRFVALADIKSFFTRISKDTVTKIVAEAAKEDAFVDLFRAAIDVELSNMAQLRGKAKDFPIEDIGVAQGNSLSPLLGNIILSDFDNAMNDGDCKCIRYIDDFIILAPSKRAATARLRKAIKLLSALGMELSPEKSSKGGFSIDDGFDFLGINICRGAIRPGSKAQQKIISSIAAEATNSLKAMRGLQHNNPMDRALSVTNTMKRIDGIIDGWGKHYWFCNDKQIFINIDKYVEQIIIEYLGEYKAIRSVVEPSKYRAMLGVSELCSMNRDPFVYPKLKK